MLSTKGIPNRCARFLRFSSSSSTGVAAPAAVGVAAAGVGTISEACDKIYNECFTLWEW